MSSIERVTREYTLTIGQVQQLANYVDQDFSFNIKSEGALSGILHITATINKKFLHVFEELITEIANTRL